jgi:hypothetical protein
MVTKVPSIKNLGRTAVSIDPLSVLLGQDIYQHLVEKFDPHTAKTADVVAALKDSDKSVRTAAAKRLKVVAEVVERLQAATR